MAVKHQPNVAIVGAGWMGETHLRCYVKQGVPVVGIVDPDTDKAMTLAHRYGVTSVYPTFEQLLAEHQPTGISITSPENRHAEAAIPALERGIGTLIEKPMADNLHDALRIVETSERCGAVLVPAHVLRFSGPYRALREDLQRGDIGEIVGFTARRDRTRAIGEHYGHVHPAYLTLVHDIDQIIWLTQSRFLRVRALEHRRNPQSQADLVMAQGQLDSGAIVSLVSATLHPRDSFGGNSDRLEVYGSEGVATVDLSQPSVQVHGPRSHAPDWILDSSDCSGAFGAEIAHFVDCLSDGRSSDVVSPRDALEGLRAIDGILRSIAAAGSDIWLEEGGAHAHP